MRITYIGPAWGTSLHRARALERLGNVVLIIDPWAWLGRSKWVDRWIYHAGAMGIGIVIDKRLVKEVQVSSPDLIWINQGEFLGYGVLRALKQLDKKIINYTEDNPFVDRDKHRFSRYIDALPYYDLIAVVRDENVYQARQHGAKHVFRSWMPADEIAHHPRELSAEERRLWGSDVCFVGTWMPERGPFIAELIQRGIPLSIWGDRWEKAREWRLIKPYWRGAGIYDDDNYARVIQSAKICLGLLSKGNQDTHTLRSMEIPALGGLLCAERTLEHLALYEDGVEAVFWSNANECAEQCNQLLLDERKRTAVALAGHNRVRRNGMYNEQVLGRILDEVLRSR